MNVENLVEWKISRRFSDLQMPINTEQVKEANVLKLSKRHRCVKLRLTMLLSMQALKKFKQVLIFKFSVANIFRRIIVEAVFSLVKEKLSESDDVNAAESFMVSMLEIFVTHLRFARERELRRRIQSNEADPDGVPWSNSQDEVNIIKTINLSFNNVFIESLVKTSKF